VVRAGDRVEDLRVLSVTRDRAVIDSYLGAEAI